MISTFLLYAKPDKMLDSNSELELFLAEKLVYRDESGILYFRDFILVPDEEDDGGLAIYLRGKDKKYQWIRDKYLSHAQHDLRNWAQFCYDFKIETDLKVKPRKFGTRKKKEKDIKPELELGCGNEIPKRPVANKKKLSYNQLMQLKKKAVK